MEVQRMSFEVRGHMVQPLIGGRRSVKCVVDDGEMHYVRDTGLLLQLLHIQHPVGQHLVRVAQSFIKHHQTGAATLLFFLRSFASIAVSLTEQGLDQRRVDRLMHAALDECIQYASTLTVKLELPTCWSVSQDQGLIYSDLRNLKTKSSEQPGVRKSCNKSLPKKADSLKVTPKMQTKGAEGSRKMKVMNKKTITNCQADDKQPDGTILQNESNRHKFPAQSTIRHQLNVGGEFDPTGHDDGFQEVNLIFTEHKQGKPKCSLEQQPFKPVESGVNSPHFKKNEIQILAGNAKCQVKDDIPLVELKMKNIQNERHDLQEDTDWFFESDQTSASSHALEQEKSKIIDSSPNESQNIDILKQKWDMELLNDIIGLKEGIENDLKIVHERRERLNKKLARYIRTKSEGDTDDEFENCFDNLRQEENNDSNCRGCIKNFPCSEKADAGYMVAEDANEVCQTQAKAKIIESVKKELRSMANILEKKVYPSSNCPAFVKIAACEGSDHREKDLSFNMSVAVNDHSLGTRTNNELFQTNCCVGKSTNTEKVKSTSRHLNQDECKTGKEVISDHQSDYQTVDMKNEVALNNSVVTLKHKQKTVNDKPYEFSLNACDHKICKAPNDSGSKHKINAQTSMQKIDALLAGLGMQNKNTSKGIQKLSRCSRHIGEADSNNVDERKKSDEVLFTLEVQCHSKSEVPLYVVNDLSDRHKDSFIDTMKGLAIKERKDEEEKIQSGLDQSQEMGGHLWLYQLIRGLCPQIETGITEVVQQYITKQVRDNFDGQRLNFKNVNNRLITCFSECGVLPQQPRLADGVIVSTKADTMELLQKWKDKSCRILIVNGDMQANFHHKGFKKIPNATAVGGIEILSGHRNQISQWLLEVMSVLRKHSVNIVLVKGLVSEEALLQCQQEGIIVMEMVPYKILNTLSEACQIDMVTYVMLTTENDIGSGVTVFPWKSDWMDKGEGDKYRLVLKVAETPLQTVVFSELNSHIASLKEQEFWECFHLVTSSLQSGCVLPGGGRTEAKCMEFCWKRAEDTRTPNNRNQPEPFLSVVFEELAYAFKEYVDNYSVNNAVGKDRMEENYKSVSFTKLERGKQSEMPNCCARFSGTMTENKFHNHSETLSENSERQSANQSMKNCFALNDTVTRSDSFDKCDDTSLKQPPDFYNCSNYLDNYVTKLAAWRLALDTVFVILGIDTFIQTGFTDDIMDKKGHSGL